MGSVVRFGAFELNLRTRELRNRGIRVRLRDQSIEILAMLVECPGEVVTREEIRTRLWPSGTFVDFEHGLNSAVHRLREALGDSPIQPHFIETLPRRGYRFLSPVEAIGASETGIQPQLPGEAPQQEPPRLDAPQKEAPRPELNGTSNAAGSRWWAVAALVPVLIVAAGLAGWKLMPRTGAAPIRSIAVLPLTNLSGDPEQQYLADALTEELIGDLARIKAFRVTSRTSVMGYRNTGKPLRQIASELGVEEVVEGSFQHTGDQFRITARLLDAQTDQAIWAKTYQFDVKDISVLHGELVRRMAADMRVGFSAEELGTLSRSRQVEPDAYDAYLEGRFNQFKETEEGSRAAIRLFNKALRIDPGYAPAYAALAQTLNTNGQITGQPSQMEETRRYAQKALEIDPGLAEAHAMMGVVKAFHDYDFAGAEKELLMALKINPSCAFALGYYGALLGAVGRDQEAITMAERAVKIDPLVPTQRPTLGFRLYFARKYNEAAEQFRQVLRQTPGSWTAHLGLGSVYREQGRHQDSIDELKKALELSGGAEEERAALACAYARAGRRKEALDTAGIEVPAGGSKALSVMSRADVCVSLGQKDLALKWLATAYEQRQFRLVFLKVDPVYDSVRSDPRFQDLLRRIGLTP